jgi:hypothetical protein
MPSDDARLSADADDEAARRAGDESKDLAEELRISAEELRRQAENERELAEADRASREAYRDRQEEERLFQEGVRQEKGRSPGSGRSAARCCRRGSTVRRDSRAASEEARDVAELARVTQA